MEGLEIRQIEQNYEKAFKFIYNNYYSLLCYIAQGYVNDKFTAETLVGDVIFHLWEIRDSVDFQLSLRNYLVRAVRNRCVNYLELKRERYEVSASSLDEQEFEENKYLISDEQPLGCLLVKELEDEIGKGIASLPEESRVVFLKSRMENKKYIEIAEELDISVNTVKYHIKNALSKLEEKLGKYLITFFIFTLPTTVFLLCYM